MRVWAIKIKTEIAEWTIRSSPEVALDNFVAGRIGERDRDRPFWWWMNFQKEHDASLVELWLSEAVQMAPKPAAGSPDVLRG